MRVLSFFVDCTSTPLGELTIVADADGRLRALGWDAIAGGSLPRVSEIWNRELGTGNRELRAGSRPLSIRTLTPQGVDRVVLEPRANPGGLTAAIDAYFAGVLSAIDGLPVVTGGTPFQRAVWGELRRIPCGTTISYAELARRIGRPTAVRAVGLANGSNPVGIVVPCHRVIGSNGTLTGYGGGIERKRWLLAHEGLRSGVLGF